MNFRQKVKFKEVISSAKDREGILVVSAGNEGWEPTADELVEIQSLFTTALNDPKGAIVTVREGIKAEFISLPKSMLGDWEDVKVISK